MTIRPTTGLVVGLPCSRPVMPEWAVSLAMQQGSVGIGMAYSPVRGMKVDDARNYIVQRC